MKVLLSAYACEPGKGSEPEVGLRAMLAAATRHDVWVMTRRNNIEPLEDFLASDPAADRITLVGIDDDDGLALRLKKRLGTFGTQWYYRSWQRLAGEETQELHRRVGFDVAHHATFASYWAPIGIARLDVPLVVGPVGGGVNPPLRLMPELGPIGMLTDGVRLIIRTLMARLPGALADLKAARVVLVQNPETLARIGHPTTGRLLSNALSVDLGRLPPAPEKRTREIITTGRLIPLKGGVTAVRALSHVSDTDARLVFVGDGPERDRIERLADRLGLSDRVEILGWRPRDEVVARVREAGVYLHTAIHDEASLSVAEALSQGTPVVGYDHGGPAQVMSSWPSELWAAVPASGPDTSARRLAAACDDFLFSPPPIPSEVLRPARSYTDAVLDAYEEAVAR